jgi:hypothetical protein
MGGGPKSAFHDSNIPCFRALVRIRAIRAIRSHASCPGCLSAVEKPDEEFSATDEQDCTDSIREDMEQRNGMVK